MAEYSRKARYMVMEPDDDALIYLKPNGDWQDRDWWGINRGHDSLREISAYHFLVAGITHVAIEGDLYLEPLFTWLDEAAGNGVIVIW